MDYYILINFDADTPEVLGLYKTLDEAKLHPAVGNMDWFDPDPRGRICGIGLAYQIHVIEPQTSALY